MLNLNIMLNCILLISTQIATLVIGGREDHHRFKVLNTNYKKAEKL